MSFVKVVYPLKFPGTACLSYLDNGLVRCLTNETPVNKFLSKIKHLNNQSILDMPLSNIRN